MIDFKHLRLYRYFIILILICTAIILLFISQKFTVRAFKPNSKSSESISVKTFGAKGNGITDDSQSIQTALDSCVGKTLFFPAGTYMLHKTITVPSNIILLGEDGTILKASSNFGVDKDLLRTYNGQNITLDSITLSGNNGSNPKGNSQIATVGVWLWDIWGCNNLKMVNCSFIDDLYPASRLVYDSSNITYDSCKFINVDCGVIFQGSGNVDQLVVTNSIFDGHEKSEPISFFGSGKYTNITISNNTMQNKTHGKAINIMRGTVDNIKIFGNTLVSDACGVYIADEASANIEVYNNNIESTGIGIRIKNSSKVNAHDNTISKTRSQGLFIENCSDVTFSKNTVTDCGSNGINWHAIHLKGDCNNITLDNNTLVRTDPKLSECSMLLECTGTVEVTNNNFTGCKMQINYNSLNVNISH